MSDDVPKKLDERYEAKERRMIELARLVHNGFSPLQAAKKLGYKKGNGSNSTTALTSHPAFKKEIARLRQSSAAKMRMSREKVEDIVLEAIQMGRMIGDPMSMIRGAQELNKMCGYYAAEKKEVTLNDSQKRVLQKFDDMSDDELLQAIGDDSNVIEGEFESIPPPSQETEIDLEVSAAPPESEEIWEEIESGDLPRPDHAIGL